MACLTVGWIVGVLGNFYCYSNLFSDKEKGLLYIPGVLTIVELLSTFVIIILIVVAILVQNPYLNYLFLIISVLCPNMGYVLCMLSNFVVGPAIDLINENMSSSSTPINIDIGPIS